MTGIELGPDENKWYVVLDYDINNPEKESDEIEGCFDNPTDALKRLLEVLARRMKREADRLLTEIEVNSKKAQSAAAANRFKQAERLWFLLGLDEEEPA